MSDYRAIAAATATLQSLLAEAVRESVPGASVATGPPPAQTEHEHAEGMINVFLYKIEPNKVWRNEELPYRRSDGSLSRRPQLAIDLYYLLSFYGDDNRQIPNLLLGAAVGALHAEPYPPSRFVPQESAAGAGLPIAGTGGPNLAGSGLLKQSHPLSFTLLSSDQDEVINTWTRLMHSSYVLSVAYIGRVVQIEPEVNPEPALPARRTAVHYRGSEQPRLASVTPGFVPYSTASELRLTGSQLDAEHVKVLIGELEVEPIQRSPEELEVLIPDGAWAGTNLVRVAHGHERDGKLRWDVVSNPLAVVIQPVVLDTVARPDPTVEADEGLSAIQLGVRFAPVRSAVSDVEVLLNPTPTRASETRRGQILQATTDPMSPGELMLDTQLAPGRYLVRVRILGVESPLDVDEDPLSPNYERYVGPVVEVR